MRVIAGRFKGRRLEPPSWAGLRPTSDKLKGQLFEILGAAIGDATVLDGFAGSGALGIEALSRGARHVTFVDSDARAIALAAENLRRCGAGEGYAMMRGEVAGIVSRLPADRLFDVILLDPPYDDPSVNAALEAASARLAPGGILVLEHARRTPPPDGLSGVVLGRQVRSGDSSLAFYRAGPRVRPRTGGVPTVMER